MSDYKFKIKTSSSGYKNPLGHPSYGHGGAHFDGLQCPRCEHVQDAALSEIQTCKKCKFTGGVQ